MPITIVPLESNPILIFYMTGQVRYGDVRDAIQFVNTHISNRNLKSLYSVIHMHDFEMSDAELLRGGEYASLTTLSNQAPYLLTPLAVGESKIAENTLQAVKTTTGIAMPKLPTIEKARDFAEYLHGLHGDDD